MLISIETHRTCDFLGGWGGVGCGPPNPLWIHASSVGLGMLISEPIELVIFQLSYS